MYTLKLYPLPEKTGRRFVIPDYPHQVAAGRYTVWIASYVRNRAFRYLFALRHLVDALVEISPLIFISTFSCLFALVIESLHRVISIIFFN